MNRIILAIMLLLTIRVVVIAQVIQKPVTPSAQEFLKYGEIPVSEYTGIPNISIPLYSIQGRDINIPVELKYHAGGIRVTDEASWVGLGWDLQFGSVVQMIMDQDDFITDPMFSKKKPDFHNSPIPMDFPHRHDWPFTNDGWGWSPTLPVYDPTDNHSFKVATGYYVPINGNYTQEHQDLFESNYVDSEPDVIKMNFLGHSLHVVYQKGSLKVLNEKGYIVRRTNTSSDDWGWEVVAPNGNIYSFEIRSETEIDHNYSTQGEGNEVISSLLSHTPQKQWFLTKITTAKKEVVNFKYGLINKVTNFPSYSQKYVKNDEGDTSIDGGCVGKYYALLKIPLKSHLVDYVFRTSQQLPYLTEIDFTNGKIQFTSSAREDVLGARKLDVVKVLNNKSVIKQFDFRYEYFEATNASAINDAGGLGGLDENKEKKRLKLKSLKESGKEPYEFNYNSMALPYKGTFAVDYWGFYNGNHSNNSLIPNPSRFGKTSIGYINSNNHSANLNYAKAGILEAIKYPTKGITEFEYELNEFDNYWVPSYQSLTNKISKGNGLRIRAISNKDYDGTFIGKTIYQYEGGKSIVPRNFFNSYGFNYYNPNTKENTHYYATEIFCSNAYSSNLFGSVNGVGYNVVKVEETTKDELNCNGRKVMTFSNHPDRSYQMNHNLMSLPVITDRSKFANGSLLKEVYSVRKGSTTYIPLKTVKYDYEIDKSSIYYGARIMPYPTFIYRYVKAGTYVCLLGLKPRHLIGYYPLYSDKTLMKTKEVVDYHPFYGLSSDSVYTKTIYRHNSYNIIDSKSVFDVFDNELSKEIYRYPEYNSTLAKKNMLNTLVSKCIYRQNKFYTLEKYNYTDKGDLTLLNEHLTYFEGFNYKTPRSVIYKEHDEGGNVTKYETSTGEITYILWAYNKSYPVAQIVSSNGTIPIREIQSAIDLLSLSEYGSKNSVDGDISKIQNVISASSQIKSSDVVTIFTYKPLVGMTSQTDMNGITTYYEYDSYSRLEYIRDNEGNIIKQNVYNYKK